jgi:RNA polymerase sigma factor (sigma-70 family)
MSRADQLFEELIEPIKGQMIATVMRIVRDPHEAEDVMQIALTAIWRKLARIHRHPNPQAYVMRICISRSYDAMRRSRRMANKVLMLESAGLEALPDPSAQSADDLERERAVHTALFSLPGRQGKALLLRVAEKRSYETIADILGCSPATARSHVSKARERLRMILEREQIIGGEVQP